MNTQLLIGGRLVGGEGAADVVLDAATGAQIASVPAASVPQVRFTSTSTLLSRMRFTTSR